VLQPAALEGPFERKGMGGGGAEGEALTELHTSIYIQEAMGGLAPIPSEHRGIMASPPRAMAGFAPTPIFSSFALHICDTVTSRPIKNASRISSAEALRL
jgi:hypothetical protein